MRPELRPVRANFQVRQFMGDDVFQQEANRVLLKPMLIEALQALNEGLGR